MKTSTLSRPDSLRTAVILSLLFTGILIDPANSEENLRLGIEFLRTNQAELSKHIDVKGMKIPSYMRGFEDVYLVKDFLPLSKATESGIQRNDLLFKAGSLIKTTADFEEMADSLAGQSEVELTFKRIVGEGQTRRFSTKAVTLKLSTDQEVANYLKEMQIKKEAEEKRMAERRKALGPLPIDRIGMKGNAIGVPVVTIGVWNNSQQIIEAAEYKIECLDSFNRPVKAIAGGNTANVIWQGFMKPEESKLLEYTLNLRETTRKIAVWVTRIKYGNGTEWSQTKEQAERDKRLVRYVR